MNELLIAGIDGGATKVSGWLIEQDEKTGKFRLGKKQVYQEYRDHPLFDQSFQPVPILDQFNKAAISSTEEQQAKVWVETCASVISELMQDQQLEVIVGIGMPGLKTPDGRGIYILANGPRNPFFSEQLEALLRSKNIRLAMPIARLGSDADYCGIGEESGASGAFSHCRNAYYLGGGTGVADALKLKGQLVPFDAIKAWMAKSWELKTSDGLSVEKYISAKGIQAWYARISRHTVEELEEAGIYGTQILDRAVQGEEAARECMDRVTRELAKLIYERITTMYFGWRNDYDFVNPGREKPSAVHPYLETLLDRIIFGQRLGELLEQSRETDWVWKPLLQLLGSMVTAEKDASFVSHYTRNGQFTPELLQISSLREAPALGAGIDAYQTYSV